MRWKLVEFAHARAPTFPCTSNSQACCTGQLEFWARCQGSLVPAELCSRMFVVPSQNLRVGRLQWNRRWETSGSLCAEERKTIRDRNCLPWVTHDEQTSGVWGIGNCNEGFESMWAHNGLTKRKLVLANYVCHCPASYFICSPIEDWTITNSAMNCWF